MTKKKILRVIIGTCLVLLVPLLAMGVSDEVQWNWFDFAVIGFLLVSAGLLYELLAHWLTAKYRPIAAIVLVVLVLLVWVELSVGIFETPLAGN